MHNAQQRNKHKPASFKAKFDRVAERAARHQRKQRTERIRFTELAEYGDEPLTINAK